MDGIWKVCGLIQDAAPHFVEVQIDEKTWCRPASYQARVGRTHRFLFRHACKTELFVPMVIAESQHRAKVFVSATLAGTASRPWKDSMAEKNRDTLFRDTPKDICQAHDPESALHKPAAG